MNIVATVFHAPLNAIRSLEGRAADAIINAARHKREGNCGCGQTKAPENRQCDECYRDSQW